MLFPREFKLKARELVFDEETFLYTATGKDINRSDVNNNSAKQTPTVDWKAIFGEETTLKAGVLVQTVL